MKTITIQKIDKQDHEAIILLYLESYLAEWEKRNKEQITPFVNYLLKRPFKLKAVVDGKIIWGFISDIKPRHEGNILFDPESLFILTIKIKDSEDTSCINPYFKLNKRIKSLI